MAEAEISNATLGNDHDISYRQLEADGSNSSQRVIKILLSLALFILAGLAEIGGGYLMWIGIRQKVRPLLYIPLGGAILVIYGFIPTLQPMDSFGRVFAVYGGFFILLSYAWGAFFDGMRLDYGDYIGTTIAVIGVCVCWFWPR